MMEIYLHNQQIVSNLILNYHYIWFCNLILLILYINFVIVCLVQARMTSNGIRFIFSDKYSLINSSSSSNSTFESLIQVSNKDNDVSELLKYPAIIHPHLDLEKPFLPSNYPIKLCVGVPNQLIAQGLTIPKNEGGSNGNGGSGGTTGESSSRENRNFKDTMVSVYYSVRYLLLFFNITL